MTSAGQLDNRLPLLQEMIQIATGKIPNHSQVGIALAVTKMDVYRKQRGSNRSLTSVPAGCGKSVILTVLAALLQKSFKAITLLYSDVKLMDFEATMIKTLQASMGLDTKLRVATIEEELTELNKFGHPILAVPENTLVLVDEADFLFMDQYC